MIHRQLGWPEVHDRAARRPEEEEEEDAAERTASKAAWAAR